MEEGDRVQAGRDSALCQGFCERPKTQISSLLMNWLLLWAISIPHFLRTLVSCVSIKYSPGLEVSGVGGSAS